MILGRLSFSILKSIRGNWQHNLNIHGINRLCTNFKMSTDIVWIDLEMTGLNVDTDKIIEIACVITDGNLKVISPDFHEIIHYSDEVLDNMNDWCKKTHAESGLIDEIRKSNVKWENAEENLLNFIKTHVKYQRTVPLAGNSIWMDRFFLRKHMPIVDEYLHYRIIDVSSIKELVRRWNPTVFALAPKKKICHRAVDDIYESIAELDYYRNNFFQVKI